MKMLVDWKLIRFHSSRFNCFLSCQVVSKHVQSRISIQDPTTIMTTTIMMIMWLSKSTEMSKLFQLFFSYILLQCNHAWGAGRMWKCGRYDSLCWFELILSPVVVVDISSNSIKIFFHSESHVLLQWNNLSTHSARSPRAFALEFRLFVYVPWDHRQGSSTILIISYILSSPCS